VVPNLIGNPSVTRCGVVIARVAMTGYLPLILVVVIIETGRRGKIHLAPLEIITIGAVPMETSNPAVLK
jgi:hypothetical protein